MTRNIIVAEVKTEVVEDVGTFVVEDPKHGAKSESLAEHIDELPKVLWLNS